jgi:hypothetical protein
MILVSFSAVYAQTIRYVVVGGAGAGDGSSWADASGDIQEMINTVSSDGGGQVWVAAGIYKPNRILSNPTTATLTPTNRGNAFVLRANVQIYGGFDGDENVLSDRHGTASILSGNIGTAGDADNTYHVVVGSGNLGTAVLDGFTVRDGYADGGGSTGVFSNAAGGGIALNATSSSPQISHCIITNNYAGDGGGIYNNNNSSPIISNSLININTIDNNGNKKGGGIYNNGSSPTIINCTLYSIDAENGIIHNAGSNSIPTIVNSIIWGPGTETGIKVTGNPPVANVTYSIVVGGYPGTGNSKVDPMLSSDFRLQNTSVVAINKGDNTSYDNKSNVIPDNGKDLAGNVRVKDAIIDIGAYEGPLESIIITPDAGKSKTYGNSDPIFTYKAIFAIGGGDASAEIIGGALSREEGEDVGTYEILLGDLTVSSKYNIIFTTGVTFEITPAVITVTADAGQNKVYGEADPDPFTYTITSGSLFGTDVFTGKLARVAGENVGKYAIMQGTLSAGTNYTITFVSADFEITKATLTVTAHDAVKKEDGSPYPTTDYLVSYSGFVFSDSESDLDGTLDFSTGASYSATAKGEYAIVPSGLTSQNYNISFVNGKLTITDADPIPQVIVINFAANNITKTYGEIPFSPDVTVESGLQIDFESDDNTIASVNDYKIVIHKVGTVTIKAYQRGGVINDIVYGAAQDVTFTVTIDPAPLTITANNVSVPYNGIPYSGGNGVTYTGFVYGETSSVLSGTLSYIGNSQGATAVGTYTILPQGLTSPGSPGNYNITFMPGTLTIIETTPSGGIVFPGPYTVTYTPQLTLADIELPAGFTWEFPATRLFVGDGQQFPAIYTYPSSSNAPVHGVIIVNVLPQSGGGGGGNSTLQREIRMPNPPAGVVVLPSPGIHFIKVGEDFHFKLTFTNGQVLRVFTSRIDPLTGKQEELIGTRNDDGDYEYTLENVVTQPVYIYIGNDGRGPVSSNEVIDKAAVWTSGNTLYINIPRADVANIYSILGLLVKRIEVPEGGIAEPLPKGVYIVKLQSGSVHKVMSR